MGYSNNFVTTLIPLVTDLTSADKMEMSEMLYEKSFVDADAVESNEIVTGVSGGEVVPILKDTPNPDSFPFVSADNCDINECETTHEYSSHTWEIGLIECRTSICLRTFNNNFLKFFNDLKRTQAGGQDIDLDSALMLFISGKFNSNLNLSIWRAAWFGDKSSASAYYNGVNGMFTQMEANTDQVITLTQNAEATFALQQGLTGEQIYAYMIQAFNKASEAAWFDPSLCEFRVTRTVSLKLVAWLNEMDKKAPNNCECLDPVSGASRNTFVIEGLTVSGIPVVTRNEWDKIIHYSAELNGGGGANARVNPHRIVLTYRENLLIGTTETEALNSFDIWHSKDDKKVYLEGSSYVGGAVPLREEYVLVI